MAVTIFRKNKKDLIGKEFSTIYQKKGKSCEYILGIRTVKFGALIFQYSSS